MSRTLTALKVTPGITYCTNDGVPYRADDSGIVHVETRHVNELVNVRSVAQVATGANVVGTIHRGAALALVVENG